MLIERIGEPATLELFAEECTELAHAALKLARVERGENPTPKSKEDCYAAVIEEWVDVIICMEELADMNWNDSISFERIYEDKIDRMRKRLGVNPFPKFCHECGAVMVTEEDNKE